MLFLFLICDPCLATLVFHPFSFLLLFSLSLLLSCLLLKLFLSNRKEKHLHGYSKQFNLRMISNKYKPKRRCPSCSSFLLHTLSLPSKLSIMIHEQVNIIWERKFGLLNGVSPLVCLFVCLLAYLSL